MRTDRAVAKRTTRRDAAGASGGALTLVVVGDGVVHHHPLPASGVVALGRSERSDVFIDDPSISRRHALLHIGPPLAIEDLGSANGTRVGDALTTPHQAVRIVPNQPIEVGSTMVLIQTRPGPARGRRVWAPEYFEARVEEECRRAVEHGSSFAVVHLDVGRRSRAATTEALFGEVLGTTDVVGARGPGAYDVLIAAATAGEVEVEIVRVIAALADRGVEPHHGAARYGVDGRDAESLIAAAACEDRAPPEGRGAAVMDQLHRLVERIAPGDINVLILGETGVGKEVMAERVHRQSPRAARPFLRLNCAALSESLLESELFGHERGAFTGAVAVKPGLLETAEGGTVFLDEIGELPPGIQVKLLRVIEDRVLRRVGAVKPKPIDVRFLAATNRDLGADVALGRFREDLYYRLNGISLSIPPLRERVGEIAGLARELVAAACRRAGRAAVELGADAMAALVAHAWPGNIRELRNVVERAVLLAGDGPIRAVHLTLDRIARRADAVAAAASEPSAAPPATLEALDAAAVRLRRELDDLERRRIGTALAECAGNQSRAAQLLGMPRRTLVAKLAQLKIPRPLRRR